MKPATLLKLDRSKFDLSKWLSCTSELKKLGFSLGEIKTALKQAGLRISDLVDIEPYQQEPSWYIHERVSDEYTKELEQEVKHRGTASDYTVCTRHHTESVIDYRIPARYQGLKHEAVIRRLLSNRFEWFKKFKWSVYEMHGEGRDYEIYLETKAGSIYVPVKALLKESSKIIENRMLSYFGDSRSQRDPKVKRHNHLKNQHQQTNGGCPLCQEVFYQASIKPLKSATYKRLKEMMKR